MQQSGILHRYAPKLVAFEHTATPTHTPIQSTTSTPKNLLLWIGGLSDGLLTVEYPSKIAACLPPTWSIVEVLLSSSYEGWRTGSLARDAAEIYECVKYFRARTNRESRKTVLMGHSTGCQDIMEYLVGRGSGGRLATVGSIDGAILQGGVSDREAAAMEATDGEGQRKLEAAIEEAEKLVGEGREHDIVSREGHPLVGLGEPGVSAYRTASLLADGGDDDYFSSDLEDSVLQRNFGGLAQATGVVMFLLGEADQHVPASLDKQALLGRWTGIIRQNGGTVDTDNGGVVPGARHNLNGDPEDVVQDLVNRVVKFLESIDHHSLCDAQINRRRKKAAAEEEESVMEHTASATAPNK